LEGAGRSFLRLSFLRRSILFNAPAGRGGAGIRRRAGPSMPRYRSRAAAPIRPRQAPAGELHDCNLKLDRLLPFVQSAANQQRNSRDGCGFWIARLAPPASFVTTLPRACARQEAIRTKPLSLLESGRRKQGNNRTRGGSRHQRGSGVDRAGIYWFMICSYQEVRRPTGRRANCTRVLRQPYTRLRKCALARPIRSRQFRPRPRKELDPRSHGRRRDWPSSRCPDRARYPQPECQLAGLRPPIRR
jgi:hypothetical protein